jgi:hypothetical protein
MSSGLVLVPRLGVGDPQCNIPVVAGYYADGPEISGSNYGFGYLGSWYQVKAGAALELVSCNGITKPGPQPKCVLHAGSCRGFPVAQAKVSLPTVFAAPLAFKWLTPAP